MAVRVPLLVKVPGKLKAAGQVTSSYTDLVDVFPTLAAVAGLPAPEGVDGDDVSKLFDDPTAMVKTSAYHQYPACGMNTSQGLNVTRGQCNRCASLALPPLPRIVSYKSEKSLCGKARPRTSSITWATVAARQSGATLFGWSGTTPRCSLSGTGRRPRSCTTTRTTTLRRSICGRMSTSLQRILRRRRR